MQNIAQTAYSNAQQAMQNIAVSFMPVFERLAGTQSELKVSFEDLTLDTGAVKAKIKGQIMLSAEFAKSMQQAQTPTDSSQSQESTVSKTVVTNVSLE